MTATWAEQEVGTAELGDQRLDDRWVTLLSALGDRPNLSIPAACGGRAEMQAAYRFFDNDKVTFAKVLQPHMARTIQRMAEHEVVLLVQDTTEVDLTRPAQSVQGVGALDRSRRGVQLHVMHAFTPRSVPLGTVWADVLNRPWEVSRASGAAKRRARQHAPIERKESMRWLEGLREARQVCEQLPRTQCVCVADSEADIYELLAEPRGRPSVDWLVRACQDRALDGEIERNLRDGVLASSPLYTAELLIRKRRAKTTVEDRARRRNRATRQASVQVRAATLMLRPPWRADRKLPAAPVSVVCVREPNPPPGEPRIEWLLLTTLPIDTLEQVRTVVDYYCVRWCIEILFRTLKSGCRVERRRFEHVDRVLPCLALYMIVAWRTLFVCHMGRTCPDLDCQVIFEAGEWKSVWVAVHRTAPPKHPPPLGTMVHLIAQLGGYIERKHSEPGPQTVWIGLQRMDDLAWAWNSFGPETKLHSR